MADLEVLPTFGGGTAPAGMCSRVVQDEPLRLCGREAQWHVVWTATGVMGALCSEHRYEARRRWVFFAMHPFAAECSVPGALFRLADNACTVDDVYWP